jgi:hypothetical protein
MLLKAEDKATFKARITHKDAEVWASYSVEGEVNGAPVKQGDKRMFASEQEARSWLLSEADLRGFGSVEPELDLQEPRNVINGKYVVLYLRNQPKK